jgi:hypothetical protein
MLGLDTAMRILSAAATRFEIALDENKTSNSVASESDEGRKRKDEIRMGLVPKPVTLSLQNSTLSPHPSSLRCRVFSLILIMLFILDRNISYEEARRLSSDFTGEGV